MGQIKSGWGRLLALALLLSSVAAPLLTAPGIALAEGARVVGSRPAELTATKPFKPLAEVVSTGPSAAQVRVSLWMFKADHYIYDAKTSVEVIAPEGVTAGAVVKPTPEKKFDPNFGEEKLIFHGTPTFEVPLTLGPAVKGDVPLTVKVKYQGCNPAQCFFPTTEELKLTLKVGDGGADAAPAAAPAGEVAPAAAPAGEVAPPAPAADVEDTGQEAAPSATAEGAAPPPPAEAAPVAAAPAQVPAAPTSSSQELLGVSLDLDSALDSNLGLAFLVVFLAGVLTSLTPCVYPVIPITLRVLGAAQSKSKVQGFSLALVYVLGMAAVYTGLGVAAAASNSLFGSWLQHPMVVGFLVVVFIALGFSMLGAFDLAIPSSVATRLQGVQGRGYPGAALAGMVSGIVVGPCSAPVLLSLLAWIGRSGSLAMGSALMFTYAMGIGVLFLVLGTFAVSLPRSGAWMDTVKGVLALMIFALAVYYMRLLVSPGVHALITGAFAVAAGTFVGAFHPVGWDDPWMPKARKAAGILAVVAGLFFVLDGMLLSRGVSDGIAGLGGGQGSSATALRIQWEASEPAGLARAREQGRPAIVDFTADWCGVCQEIKHEVLSDPRVVSKMDQFVPIIVDGSSNGNPDFEPLKAKYGVTALPKIVFIDVEGKVVEELAVTEKVAADEFLRRMDATLSRGRTASR